MSSDYKAGQILTATELNGSFDEKTDNNAAKINGGYADNLDHVTIAGTVDSVSPSSGALIVTGGVGIGMALNVGGKLSAAGDVKFTSQTASGTPATGALVVSGGVGIGQSLNVGGGVNSAGVVAANDPSDAVDAASGSLRTAGGLGVGKSAWIGANLRVLGVLTASGGATVAGGLTVDSMAIETGGSITFPDGTEQVTKAIDDAPNDANTYGRKANAWVVLPNLPDAPADAQKYGRKNNAWTVLTDIDEAPMDGNQYSRKDGSWAQTFASGMWMGDAPPSDTDRYPQWWDSSTGNFYVWYEDANSSQWVLSLPGNIGPQGILQEAPTDGATYGRKNGAWVVTANTTGQTLLQDGTIAAPGLAWASEPGLGWYRTGAGRVQFVVGGGAVQTINGTNNNNAAMSLTPRVFGNSSIAVNSNPSGSADNRALVMGYDSVNGKTYIQSVGSGALAAVPLEIASPSLSITSGMIELGPDGGGSSWIDFKNVVGEDFTYRIAMWGSDNSLLRVARKNGTANLRLEGNDSGVSFENVNSSTGTNRIAFGWRSDGNLGLRVDATQFNNNWPISVQGVSTGALYVKNDANPSGANMKFTWSDPGGQSSYFWGGDDGANMRLTHRNNMSVGRAGRVDSIEGAGGGTVYGNSTFADSLWVNGSLFVQNDVVGKNLKMSGGHFWRWWWNGDVGDNHFYAYVDDQNQGWASLNSDERIKDDIIPMTSDTESFMRLKPINFRWKKIGIVTNNDAKMDGLSAQNVRDCFPMAAFGDFDTPPKEDGTIEFPGSVDDRAMIAHCVAQIQKLIQRMDAIDGAQRP